SKDVFPTKPLFQKELSLGTVDFPGSGVLLDPLHPPNRLDALRPGQHWRMPVVHSLVFLESLSLALEEYSANRPQDLLRMVLARVAGIGDAVPELDAEVLAETERLPLAKDAPPLPGNKLPPECLVIEARGEDTHARIWVQRSEGPKKGLVLR